MKIDYDRFIRVATRSQALASDPSQPPILGLVYKERAEAAITAFLAAAEEVNTALSAFAKENQEAELALEQVDGPYRVARSSVAAVLPESVLPATLKALPTDTDKLNAIEELLDILDDHVGKPWADALLAGDFGVKAPKTIQEINDAIAASSARTKALGARASTFGPAYESYLAFKRVVRDTLGPASLEYRRIHLRAAPGPKGEGEPEGAAPGGEAPGGGAPGGEAPGG